MTIDEFVNRHPYLYHMAEGDAWKSIERHGLRSTTALLDLFEKKKVKNAFLLSGNFGLGQKQ